MCFLPIQELSICIYFGTALGNYVITITAHRYRGHAVAQLVEVLRYKLEGRGFDSRLCHWNLSLT